jgi:hypothetical protein
MKKNILALALVLVGLTGRAQFVLTPEGFRDAADGAKTYIVLTFPDSTVEANFAKAKEFVVSSYVSPQDVLSETGTILTVNGAKSVLCRVGVGSSMLDVVYSTTITCREDRIRIDFGIARMNWGNAAHTELFLSGGSRLNCIYDNRGRIAHKDVHEKVQGVANDFVGEFQKYMTTEDDW